MISAIVLTPDTWGGDDLASEREVVARSMVWLVSAVVAGLVRDVTLATSPGLGLSDLADQSGCALVQADAEAERLAQAVRLCREPRVLLVRAGLAPEPGLIEELETFVRRAPADATAVLLRRPSTLVERAFPARAPVAAVLLPREIAGTGTSFRRLAAAARRRGTRLQTHARLIG